MFNKISKNKMSVFLLKLKLSYVVCTLLIISMTTLAILTLLLYHYTVYLGKPLPIWSVVLVIPVMVILAHFSLVALKGLARG